MSLGNGLFRGLFGFGSTLLQVLHDLAREELVDRLFGRPLAGMLLLPGQRGLLSRGDKPCRPRRAVWQQRPMPRLPGAPSLAWWREMPPLWLRQRLQDQ